MHSINSLSSLIKKLSSLPCPKTRNSRSVPQHRFQRHCEKNDTASVPAAHTFSKEKQSMLSRAAFRCVARMQLYFSFPAETLPYACRNRNAISASNGYDRNARDRNKTGMPGNKEEDRNVKHPTPEHDKSAWQASNGQDTSASTRLKTILHACNDGIAVKTRQQAKDQSAMQ